MENRPNRRTAKEIARKQAEMRQVEYDALTPEQKIALLNKRPGESARERARLAPLVVKPKRRRAKRVTAQSIREKQ